MVKGYGKIDLFTLRKCADGVFNGLGGNPAEEVGGDGVVAGTRQRIFRQAGLV